MIFDKLCKFAESNFLKHDEFEQLQLNRPLYTLVRQSALFHFPYSFHQLCPHGSQELEQLIQDGNEFWTENFFLPMTPMALEDQATLVLLCDLEKDTKGLNHFRFYFDVSGMGPSHVEGFDWRKTPEHLKQYAGGLSDDHFAISWGVMRAFSEGRQYKMEVIPGGGGLYDSARNEFEGGGELGLLMARDGGKNAMVSFEEIMWFNAPNKFVMETIPAKSKARKDSLKIPRSHERPQYTMITKDEIRKLGFREESNGGSGKSPHWVRKHFRTLRHEKYEKSGMRFKSIIVPAYFTGKTELQVGKKTYKIRIDL